MECLTTVSNVIVHLLCIISIFFSDNPSTENISCVYLSTMQPFTVLIALTAALLPTEMSGLSVSLGESVSRNLKVRDDIGWKIPRFLAADDDGDDNGDDEYDDNGNDEGDDMGDDNGDDKGDDKGDDAGGGGMQIYDWRDYSMQGLRCINWKKGVDVIVWSLYDDDYSNR